MAWMDQIEKLFKIDAIIALVLTGVYAYMCITHADYAENFQQIYLLVVGAYFGHTMAKSSEKRA